MRHVEDKPSVAFFDFDGTISTRDTLPLFLRFACGTRRCAAAALRGSPMLLGHLVGVVDNGKAKERLIGSLLAGRNRGDILAAGEAFCSSVLPAFIRAQAVERIHRHQRFGHRVVVLSASLEEWLAPWCRSLGVEICGTRLEYDAKGMATGRFATPNCHGKEKVRRAENLLGSDIRPVTYAYGDSRGDKELLVWADQSWYRPFRGTRHPIVPENDMLQP